MTDWPTPVLWLLWVLCQLIVFGILAFWFIFALEAAVRYA